jgi:hypothetical protein
VLHVCVCMYVCVCVRARVRVCVCVCAALMLLLLSVTHIFIKEHALLARLIGWNIPRNRGSIPTHNVKVYYTEKPICRVYPIQGWVRGKSRLLNTKTKSCLF